MGKAHATKPHNVTLMSWIHRVKGQTQLTPTHVTLLPCSLAILGWFMANTLHLSLLRRVKGAADGQEEVGTVSLPTAKARQESALITPPPGPSPGTGKMWFPMGNSSFPHPPQAQLNLTEP